MIERIGVIYQDSNSLGCLVGLRDRLGCRAEIIEPPTAIGTQKILRSRHAKDAWKYFKKVGVDLIVRFTDADGERWQDVHWLELNRVPSEAQVPWICGVAVDNTEHWLAIDPVYLATQVNVSVHDLRNPEQKTGHIKNAVQQASTSGGSTGDAVVAIVQSVPTEVFRGWLRASESLRQFYQDCRQAASAADCDTPNEQ